MDKNGNFYKAIEQSIIRPQSEKMKSLEEENHEFSETYIKKIEETSAIVCAKNKQKKNSGTKKKITVRTFAVIAAAAVLAGAVTVTASDSVRQMIYRLFKGSEDKAAFSSQVEYTDPPVITNPAVIAPAGTEIPVISVLPGTTVSTSTGTTVKISGTITSVTPVSSVSGEYHPLTTVTVIPQIPHHNINAYQQPSMMAPSYPTVVSTAPGGAQNPQTTTAIGNIIGGGNVTRPAVTTVPEPGDGDPESPGTTGSYTEYLPEVTSIVVVTTIKPVEATSIRDVTTIVTEVVTTLLPPGASVTGDGDTPEDPTEEESTMNTSESVPTEQTQGSLSDTTYTTTIKLT